MNRTATARLTLATLAILLAASAADGAPITFKISGVVTDASGNLPLPESIAEGVPYTALVTYNLGVADTNPDPIHGRFDHPAGMSSIAVNMNGAVFASALTSPAEIHVDNDRPTLFYIGFPPFPSMPGDNIYLHWNGMTGPGHYDELNARLLLADPSGEALTSDELPTAIDAEAFGVRWIQIAGRHQNEAGAFNPFSITMRIDSISVVPEPSSLALAAVGAVAMLTLVSRRRR